MSTPSWDDERLLEWILNPDGRDPAEDARLAADPDALRRHDELTGFLATCRSSLDTSPLTSPDLVPEVLARTTREDLSWRGDLRLLGGYLRERLSASHALRVAAASLLVHLAVLPVLAYFVLFVPRQGFDLKFEQPLQSPFEEAVEPELPMPVPEIGEEPRVREVDPQDVGDGR